MFTIAIVVRHLCFFCPVIFSVSETVCSTWRRKVRRDCPSQFPIGIELALYAVSPCILQVY